MLLWSLIGIVLFLITLCEVYTFRTGVPTVTSNPSIRRKMIEILKEEADRHNGSLPFQILDLGSGTGKLALEIGRALPDVVVTGIEISVVPHLFSRLRKLLWGVKNVHFVRKDFWTYDVSSVNAVTLYINDAIRARVAEKLKAELTAGTLVISNESHLPDWTPIATHDKIGLLKVQMVVYRQP